MEFQDVVRRRRMVRRFDPDRAVPAEAVTRCLQAAVRAPSAGFSQGWDFVVLTSPDDRAAYWRATTGEGEPDSWLTGVSAAPVLVVCCASPDAYLDRYAEPDKGFPDRDRDRWPIPYWDVDTGMAALLVLLSATDQGLGSLFFGVPGPRHQAVRAAFGIPQERRLVGVVALGHEQERWDSPSLRRGRREVGQVAHWGRFGASGP